MVLVIVVCSLCAVGLFACIFFIIRLALSRENEQSFEIDDNVLIIQLPQGDRVTRRSKKARKE